MGMSMRLGESNAWKVGDADVCKGSLRKHTPDRYDGNDLSISYETISPLKYKITITINSLSYALTKVMEYGNLYICLASQEIRRHNSKRCRFQSQDMQNAYVPGSWTYDDMSTITQSQYKNKYQYPVFQKVVPGKRDYTFVIDMSNCIGFSNTDLVEKSGIFRSRNLQNGITRYLKYNPTATPFFKICGRLVKIPSEVIQHGPNVYEKRELLTQVADDSLAYEYADTYKQAHCSHITSLFSCKETETIQIIMK